MTQPNTTRRFLWFLLAVLLLILILAAIAWWIRTQPSVSEPPTPTTLAQPSSPESPTLGAHPSGDKYYYAGPPNSSHQLAVA